MAITLISQSREIVCIAVHPFAKVSPLVLCASHSPSHFHPNTLALPLPVQAWKDSGYGRGRKKAPFNESVSRL